MSFRPPVRDLVFSLQAAADFARSLGRNHGTRNVRGAGSVGLEAVRPTESTWDAAAIVKGVQDEVFPYDKNIFRSEKTLLDSLAKLDTDVPCHSLMIDLVFKRDFDYRRDLSTEATMQRLYVLFCLALCLGTTLYGQENPSEQKPVAQNAPYSFIARSMKRLLQRPNHASKRSCMATRS